MSKRIRLGEAEINNLLSYLKNKLETENLPDGKLDVTYSLSEDTKQTAEVVFEPLAYLKMTALVQHFDTEVAWHGTVTREGNVFTIKDVLIYPQEVSGGTVNTDQEEYEKWLYALDDGVFNTLRMQGHSHVRMSTCPSGVDLVHQEGIIEQLEDDDFFIFIIWNKKGENTIKIYDLANNTLYEDKDITLRVEDEFLDYETFITDAVDKVKAKTCQVKTSKISKSSKKSDDSWGYLYQQYGW